MRIHILGIGGKFMSGLAMIAKQMGYQVSGSDVVIVPPLAEKLQALGIELIQGYEANSLPPVVDYVIIGNALSRGVPVIEHILNAGIPYYSGPEWLSRHVLTGRWVLAVSGTHGKTTTTSMLAWILETAGYNPGFLIGGEANNFDVSARYTSSSFFVIEADEYDTAFFDKRSKFIHYQPKTLIINNIEFDHGDIFSTIEDIKTQFANLLRLVPGNGLLVVPQEDPHVAALLAKGCWTPSTTFGPHQAQWSFEELTNNTIKIISEQQSQGKLKWNMLGQHNRLNALAAIAAAKHVGVMPQTSIQALSHFKGVKRRLELRGVVNDIHVYDDFAHHPTAIAATIAALRSKVGKERIFAVVEFGSNTMCLGQHRAFLPSSLNEADSILLLQPKTTTWNMDELLEQCQSPVKLFAQVTDIVQYLVTTCQAGDHVLCMSNKMFDDIHKKLLLRLGEDKL